MKLRIFQANKGDCILLTSSDGKNILADGGMTGSFEDFAAPALHELRNAGEVLDVVYVSHVDEDHIGGILRLVDHVFDWKVYHLHHDAGDTEFKKPGSLEPPEVKQIWHNAFHEIVGDNEGPIEDILAANAPLLSTLKSSWAPDVAELSARLATSMRQAVQLSKRVSPSQLGIPLNPPYNGHLMYTADPIVTIQIGSFSIQVIAPFEDDLDKLRSDWNKWLKKQATQEQLEKIKDEARRDADLLKMSEFDRITRVIGLEASHLGDKSDVTPPNLASIMLLVEDNGRRALMTGDGHYEAILAGLETAGVLNSDGCVHVDVFKVPHHGSPHNSHPDLCRQVTADHYLFCGNGFKDNPDLDVIQAFIDSRMGSGSALSKNPEAGNKFTMWFNSRESVATYGDHMKAVEKAVKKAAAKSNGQITYHFLESGSFPPLELD